MMRYLRAGSANDIVRKTIDASQPVRSAKQNAYSNQLRTQTLQVARNCVAVGVRRLLFPASIRCRYTTSHVWLSGVCVCTCIAVPAMLACKSDVLVRMLPRAFGNDSTSAQLRNPGCGPFS